MNFNELSCNLKKCKICENKFGFKPHPIVWGDKEAKIVQISQAPSATVYKTQRPFSDQSGKKLKYEWYQIDDNSFYNINNFILLLWLIVTQVKPIVVMIKIHLQFVIKRGYLKN